MLLRTHTKQDLARYLEQFPTEAASLSMLHAQLETDTADVFDRKNMRGHVTTSAFVLDGAAAKVLLIHHKLYNRWLQPGGHFEGANPLWQSALREVVEETGVQRPQLHAWCQAQQVPLDIDSHAIAAQPKKNEGTHVHHDFVYLVTADSYLPLVPQEEEVFAAKWVSLAEIAELRNVRFDRIMQKLKAEKIIG
jgi:8-oxo-dGTP pyrophosphatase MutT (NUDIX family)